MQKQYLWNFQVASILSINIVNMWSCDHAPILPNSWIIKNIKLNKACDTRAHTDRHTQARIKFHFS